MTAPRAVPPSSSFFSLFLGSRLTVGERRRDGPEPRRGPKVGWKEEERYQRCFSLVPLLEEKARQQAIDAAAK